MILKRISILNYKNLEQVELAFSPKLNTFFLYEKIKITPVFMAPLLSLWC